MKENTSQYMRPKKIQINIMTLHMYTLSQNSAENSCCEYRAVIFSKHHSNIIELPRSLQLYKILSGPG